MVVMCAGAVNLQIQLVKMAAAMSSIDLDGIGVNLGIPVLWSYKVSINFKPKYERQGPKISKATDW